jgi:glutaredoxin-like protein
MSAIKDKDQKQIKSLFKNLTHEVNIILFTRETECPSCGLTRDLLTELAALSDKIKLSVLDIIKDAESARQYRVDKTPAIVMLGERDYGIRFYGVPAGYEFTTLIEDIIMVSHREHGLKDDVLTELAKIDQPVHMQVFINPG